MICAICLRPALSRAAASFLTILGWSASRISKSVRLNGVLDKVAEVGEVAAQRVAKHNLPLRKREPTI